MSNDATRTAVVNGIKADNPSLQTILTAVEGEMVTERKDGVRFDLKERLIAAGESKDHETISELSRRFGILARSEGFFCDPSAFTNVYLGIQY